MERYHSEQHIIERNHRERIRIAGTHGKYQVQRGRYRKMDAYDCGTTRCPMCSHVKVYRTPSRSEIRGDLALKEQLAEL